MKTQVIIAAAGKGTRFASHARAKQFCKIADKPVLNWTIAAFDTCEEISSIILVIPAEMMNTVEAILHLEQYQKIKSVVSGGGERQDSVRNGLESIDPDTRIVLVHDGVRALVSHRLIRTVIHCSAKHGAAIPCMPIKETIKEVAAGGTVGKTLNRARLCLAQTPQGFRTELLRKAHEAAVKAGWSFSDEAALLEQIGQPVQVLPGEECNIKITTRFDSKLAEMLLQERVLL